ncbi:GIP, partial [Symbiodinium necroappetens]
VEQWEASMQEYVTSGKFEDGFRAVVSMPWLRNVPREELIKVVMDIPKCEEEAWELMKSMGFNRRMRKRLVHKDWVIKFYSGARSQIDKLFRPVDANNTITLDIDELRNSQWDMLKEGRGIYELLLWGAATGRVAGMMASLPKDHAEQHLSRLMMIAEVAKQGRKMMCQNVDLPDDGVAVVLWGSSEAEEDHSAQAFQKEWFKRWYIENWLDNIYFEQGGLGHPLRRPTTMVTNMDISELRGVRDERSEEATWGQWSTWAVDRRAWERHLANDHDCYVMSADTLGPVRVAGPKGEKYALVFTYQFPKQKMSAEDEPVCEAPEDEENAVFDEDLGEYEPSEQEELSQEEQPEPQEPGSLVGLRGARKKHAEAAEDWWEFREAAGVLIRHHEVPRQTLFRPSGASGCPVHPGKLDDTRITDIKYIGGGVETETSDWHGPKSGARSLGRSWTGTTRFKVSMAEVPEDEAVLQRDEEQWEKLIGDLTKPVEMETIYMVYPVRSKRGGDAMLATQGAVLRLKVLGLPVARLHTDRGVKHWCPKLAAQPKEEYDGLRQGPRRKIFGNNKKYDLTDRWEEGKYLGLSDTIKGGAVVLRATGAITETLNLREGVVDPKALLAAEEDDGGGGVFCEGEVPIIDLPEADHRLRGKEQPPDLPEVRKVAVEGEEVKEKKVVSGWKMRALVQQQEMKAKMFFEMGKFDNSACAEVLGEMELSGTMRYERYDKSWAEEDEIFNQWQESKQPDGKVVEGTIVNIEGRAAAFNAKELHAYLNSEPERWIIAAFTPLGATSLSTSTVAQLSLCGFPLDGSGVQRVHLSDEDMELEATSSSDEEEEEGVLEKKVCVLRCILEQEALQEEKFKHLVEDRLEWGQARLHERDCKVLRQVAKVSPGEAGDYEVETILENLSGPLEVVHNVSLHEARRYIDRWRGAVMKEVDALVNSGTVRRLTPEQAREMKAKGMVFLPGKAVLTAKPPSDQNNESEKFRRWRAGATDISNAFTLAPMPEDKLFGMSPPSVVVEEFIVFECLETEENVWKILFEGCDEVKGILLIYVDDLLMLSTTPIIKAVYQWLTEEWKCSPLQWMDEEHLRFLGVELRPMGSGIHVSQSGYIRDLLRQHGVQENPGSLTAPCAREWLQDPDSEDDEDQGAEEAVVKLAQKATGEILWLSTRSRPELAHPVACMASRALRKPTKTLEIAKRVMNYLSKTVEYGLHYVRDEEEALLTVYSDASYAPGGGRSFGCVMAQVAGMPVCWRASKQPIITLSVAEAELYEAVSSVQLGLGVLAMLNELGDKPVMRLKIDNAAARGLATESPGSWKTRHLRLRARFLRQEVAGQRLIISHVPGDQQKADLGTKSFDVPKFRSLLSLWRLVPFEATEEVIIKTARKLNNKNILLFAMVCFMMVQGARGTAKEDLQLDGSLEFYVIVVLGVVACVALWEVVKYVVGCGKSWWKSWQRKNKKLERLRSRAEDHEFSDYKTYGCDVYRTGSSYTGHGYSKGYGRYQARVYVSSGVYYQNNGFNYKEHSNADRDSIYGTSLDRCPEAAGV